MRQHDKGGTGQNSNSTFAMMTLRNYEHNFIMRQSIGHYFSKIAAILLNAETNKRKEWRLNTSNHL